VQPTQQTPDYTSAVAALSCCAPALLVAAWSSPATSPGGPLFRPCTPDGLPHPPYRGRHFGDPLAVSHPERIYVAWTAELTAEVRALGLPYLPHRLTPADLEKLAWLQQHLDATVRSPEWLAFNAGRLHFYGPKPPPP
jgi:hypothetical protein